MPRARRSRSTSACSSREELADLAAQLRPSPPVWLGPVAADAGATAMMDVSDGLVLDASRMAAASGVTLALESPLLGADPASALGGGEDHALLAAFPADRALPRRLRARRHGAGARRAGRPRRRQALRRPRGMGPLSRLGRPHGMIDRVAAERYGDTMTDLLPRSTPEAQAVPAAAISRLIAALDAIDRCTRSRWCATAMSSPKRPGRPMSATCRPRCTR